MVNPDQPCDSSGCPDCSELRSMLTPPYDWVDPSGDGVYRALRCLLCKRRSGFVSRAHVEHAPGCPGIIYDTKIAPFAPPGVDPRVAMLQQRNAELEKALLWSERSWKVFVVVGMSIAMFLGYHLGQMPH